MKYKNTSIVKEQMKYIPTPAAKQSGNTSSKKEWIDQVQRDVKAGIGRATQQQNTAALEQYEQPGTTAAPVDDRIVSRDLRGDRGNTDRVSNNPKRFGLQQYTDGMQVNMKYDMTLNQEDTYAGYRPRELDALEDEYTGQHHVPFYNIVERKDKETGKTVKGMLERANFLDRL